MKAILFPGQGSQLVGMGSEFYNNFSAVKKIFAEADEKLSFKISKLILEGPESELKLTQNTQPSILLVSYSIFKVLKNEFNFSMENVKFFAGHSLGEYSALLCADSLSFDDSLHLLYERGKAMQEAVPVGRGSMLAILGSDIEEINNYILEIKSKGVCEIANDNAKGQIIVSGNIEPVDELKDILKKYKKKCISLPVSAPFHCSLMNPAAIKMKDKINSAIFKKPNFEIVSNVTGVSENSPEDIKKFLVQQIYSRVRWRESIIFMNNNKINEFIEIGPGKVLTGLVKRILPNSNSFSINSIDDIKNLKNES
ncbi:MAG: ACP S-malonyltransferase [Pelagibacteraceae bacterium]|jgi:[acyl-carrier-protein] S-malonyltransferase|nr:ACP S-malonyltransferase [Pelagibacteraceae bacterium]